MTERKPHPDNELIDELQEDGPTPSQGGSAGGQVNRDVGSRTDLHKAVRDTGMERPTGQDNPAEDAMKGEKTIAHLAPDDAASVRSCQLIGGDRAHGHRHRLRTPRHIALTDVMKRDQTLIPVGMDQEEVALRFQKYGLISAAVVDPGGRLVGQLTVDDIVHIISEEAGEDALLLSGAGEGDINEPIRDAYSARVRWLVANLGTALVASLIIALFDSAIEQLVALAILMPIVASIGGNAGTQTMAVTVRAIATNQLTRSNTRRIIWREMRVALLNGATIAVLIGIATAGVFSLWLDPATGLTLGAVIAAAMVINIVVAGLAGVAVPVLLDRMDQDPAVASSVFVTMITDSMGFFAFLGLAVLSGLVG